MRALCSKESADPSPTANLSILERGVVVDEGNGEFSYFTIAMDS